VVLLQPEKYVSSVILIQIVTKNTRVVCGLGDTGLPAAQPDNFWVMARLWRHLEINSQFSWNFRDILMYPNLDKKNKRVFEQ